VLQRKSNAVTAWFLFTDTSGNGVTGLTVKVNVRRLGAAINGGFTNSATELDAADFPGVYYYTLASGSTATADDYLFLAKRTAGGAVASNLQPALWVVGEAWVENVDATVSSRAPATDMTTLLARLGAWTGTGLNTVLGGFRALANKAAAFTPSDLTATGGTFDNTTDAVEALRDRGDAAWGSSGGATAAQVWAYGTRTLTQSAAAVEAAVSGSTIACLRGDTLSAALTGVGSLTGRTKCWFTVKAGAEDEDTAALVQIEETAGLLYLNGAAGTAGQGSLTVTDAALGDLTIALAAAATKSLGQGSYRYDVQILTAAGVTTRTAGTFIVTDADDMTRAVS
jgi:hypothetical protein